MPADDPTASPAARLAELTRRLAAVERRIDVAVERFAAVRPTLIVVSKFHPAQDAKLLAQLGIRDFGENRDQEAGAKAAELASDVAVPQDLRWHFIGQLQTNKARSVAQYAHSVHSVDRVSLVTALSRAVLGVKEATGPAGRPDLQCLIQVNLDPAATAESRGRGGALPADVLALAEQIVAAPALELRGVMAVAPLGADPEPAFAALAEISARLTATYPWATAISAGMSQDLEQAIAAGATHLRVGSDVLGPRTVLR